MARAHTRGTHNWEGAASCEKMADLGQVVQVAFMLDTRSSKSNVVSRHRSLCLACTRVLLCLCGFPNRAHLKCLKWKYLFFNECGPGKVKIPHFLELKLSCIENMFNELCSELQANSVESHLEQMTVSVLCSTLIDVVQGSVWDSPDVFSPQKTVGKIGRREGGKWQSRALETEPLNVIFVCSHWPGQTDQLTGSLFPPDLSTCLLKQKIRVFWLYEGDPSPSNKVSYRHVHYMYVRVKFRCRLYKRQKRQDCDHKACRDAPSAIYCAVTE